MDVGCILFHRKHEAKRRRLAQLVATFGSSQLLSTAVRTIFVPPLPIPFNIFGGMADSDKTKPDTDMATLIKRHLEEFEEDAKKLSAWLVSIKVRSIQDFGLIAEKEEQIKTDIVDAAEMSSAVGALVGVKRIWFYARNLNTKNQSIERGEKPEPTEDEVLSLEIRDEYHTSWQKKHSLVLGGHRLPGPVLLSKQIRHVGYSRKNPEVILLETARNAAQTGFSKRNLWQEGPQGGLKKLELSASKVTNHHSVYDKIQVIWTGYSIAAIKDPDWCPYSIAEEFSDQIRTFVFATPAPGQPRATVEQLIDSYQRTMQWMCDMVRNQRTRKFADLVREQASWHHFWRTPVLTPALAAQVAGGGDADVHTEYDDSYSGALRDDLTMVAAATSGPIGAGASYWSPKKKKGRGGRPKGKGRGGRGPQPLAIGDGRTSNGGGRGKGKGRGKGQGWRKTKKKGKSWGNRR